MNELSSALFHRTQIGDKTDKKDDAHRPQELFKPDQHKSDAAVGVTAQADQAAKVAVQENAQVSGEAQTSPQRDNTMTTEIKRKQIFNEN